jgi:hypothetical protein
MYCGFSLQLEGKDIPIRDKTPGLRVVLRRQKVGLESIFRSH